MFSEKAFTDLKKKCYLHQDVYQYLFMEVFKSIFIISAEKLIQ